MNQGGRIIHGKDRRVGPWAIEAESGPSIASAASDDGNARDISSNSLRAS